MMRQPVKTTPDFHQLSEAEQAEVAERLLRIKRSGWKPFWCPDPHCDGEPHWLEQEESDGAKSNIFMSVFDTTGPNGEPLGPMLYETPGGDWFDAEEEKPLPGDTPVGRPVLDPKWAHRHSRMDQRLPSWRKPWTLFVMSGRGAGKTTTGVEFVTLSARKKLDGAIIGRRGTELVNTHVSTILARAHPEFVPEYQASKDLLVWPNGAITYLFSAERPENIRSVNLSYFWMDEAAWMVEVEAAWRNAKLATRIETPGNPIHILVTSTPTGTPWVMEMEDNPDVEVRRVSTYANKKNLSKDYLADLEKEYEGTRIGRQEIHGEVLRDVEGAMWDDSMFTHRRVDAIQFQDLLESLDNRIIAVDPAGSKGKRSDATGIIGCGAHYFDDDGNRLIASMFSVIARATLKGTPNEWAAQVYKAAQLIRANKIIAEKNFGGDMVKQVLTDYAKLNPETTRDEDGQEFLIEVVHAKSTQSKETRAEPVVNKYEQGRVEHITSPTAFGDLSDLEKQQTTWVPKSRGGKMPSPNDIDALVWAIRELDIKNKITTQQARPDEVRDRIKQTVPRALENTNSQNPKGLKRPLTSVRVGKGKPRTAGSGPRPRTLPGYPVRRH